MSNQDSGGGLVVLTGAGISHESGLATFRDPDALWASVRVEDVATPEAFATNPARVHAFYNARRRQLLSPDIQPNPAHVALAELEARWPGEFTLVTQNVDDLHERGGNRKVIHMHGELFRSLCTHCYHVAPCREDLSAGTICANCKRTGGMRPRVVWFGEVPLEMEEIAGRLQRCSEFVSIGTSGNVYPAAGFARAAKLAGAETTELNLEPSEGAAHFDEAVYGPASEVVPAFVRSVLGA